MAIPNIVINKINYTKILRDLLTDNSNNIEEKLKQEISSLTEINDKKINYSINTFCLILTKRHFSTCFRRIS